MAPPSDVASASSGSSGIIETARAKRAKFRDERITMAHGAGGKATQTLIEGLLVPALRHRRRSRRWATPARVASTAPTSR